MAIRSVNIQINDVAIPPPTISKEGNWLLYDGEKWVDTGVRAVGKDADPKALDEVKRGLANANTFIDSLDKAQKELAAGLLNKTDTKDIQYLLDCLKNGSSTPSGGLFLTNNIILSDPNSKRVTAEISGTETHGSKALSLGITYGYTDTRAIKDMLSSSTLNAWKALPSDEARKQWLTDRDYKIISTSYDLEAWTVQAFVRTGEETALSNDGTGHVGNLYFGGDRIDYKDTADSTPYLSVGRMSVKPIDTVINSNNVDTTQAITMQQLTLSASVSSNSAEDTKTIYVTNDNTAVTFNLDNMALNSGNPPNVPERNIEGAEMYFAAELTVDNIVLCRLSGVWRAKYVGSQGDGDNGMRWVYGQNDTMGSQQLSSGNLSVTHVLNSGSHTVKFRVIKTFELLKYGYDVSASLSGFTVHQVYKTDYKQAIITPSGVRFYGGGERYIDFDYLGTGGSPALKMKGGLQVDYIKTDGFYSCGNVNKWGSLGWCRGNTVTTSRERQGRYRISHSIGHTNYVITGTIIGNERMFLRVAEKGSAYVVVELHPGYGVGYNEVFDSPFDFVIHAGVK